MKAISLVFEYDFDKQKTSGRTWGEQGYKTTDFIFEYSAASFATFLHRNPDIEYEITTDNVDLLDQKLSRYNVSRKNLKIIDGKKEITEWKKHRYCFWPAMMHLRKYKEYKGQLLKLDNDLECLKPFNELIGHDGVLFWKKERRVGDGRSYWGESYAARGAFGTDDFVTYNIGVLGLPEGDKSDLIDRMITSTEKMLDVDISNVVSFPELPGFKTKIWSCSEQTAYCFTISQTALNPREMTDFFNHHCYGFDSKKDCIDSARYLLM